MSGNKKTDDTEPYTPKLSPFIESAPVWQVLAENWARKLAKEADDVRRLLPNRARQCDALAMRMRALALEFRAMQIEDPGDVHRRAVRARWIEAQGLARDLQLPGDEFT